MTTRTERQPTNAELQTLLDFCTTGQQAERSGTWSERVFALKEALDARHQWFTPEDRELGEKIRRYLRGAGMAI